jgi:hypothetical protein
MIVRSAKYGSMCKTQQYVVRMVSTSTPEHEYGHGKGLHMKRSRGMSTNGAGVLASIASGIDPCQ